MFRMEPPSLVDWIAVSLRWLALLGLGISAALCGGFHTSIAITLFAAAFWNVFLTVAAALHHRARLYRLVSVIGDLVFALGLFVFSGGVSGGMQWAGVLPVITAAVYFRTLGGVLMAMLAAALQGGLALLFMDQTVSLLFVLWLLPAYIIAGLILGLIARRMGHLLDRAERSQAALKREMERSERERSRSIYKLMAALNASLNYERVLDTALDLGGSTLAGPEGADERMVSALLMFAQAEQGDTVLRVGSARRFTQADLRTELPGTSGLLEQVIEEGEARLTKSLAKDAELSRFVALHACQSAYCLPLRAGLDTYGVLLFAHPDAEYFNADRREILDVIGNQSMVAIQNARLYRDLEQEKERITEIQEDTRKKLARDLHDGPTQSVAALAMRTNFARRLIEKDVKAAADELFKIEELARRTTKEIRHMLFTLRPLVLETQGLVPALQSMAEKVHETFNQTVIIEADQDLIAQLEMGKQGVIFYIAEEAVNNARKHARAAHIWVRLKSAGQDLALLEIEDDGSGFNLESVSNNYESRGSLGMVNMRERTELLNGVLQIDSGPGRGTRIRILIPLSEDAADRIRRGT